MYILAFGWLLNQTCIAARFQLLSVAFEGKHKMCAGNLSVALSCVCLYATLIYTCVHAYTHTHTRILCMNLCPGNGKGMGY